MPAGSWLLVQHAVAAVPSHSLALHVQVKFGVCSTYEAERAAEKAGRLAAMCPERLAAMQAHLALLCPEEEEEEAPAPAVEVPVVEAPAAAASCSDGWGEAEQDAWLAEVAHESESSPAASGPVEALAACNALRASDGYVVITAEPKLPKHAKPAASPPASPLSLSLGGSEPSEGVRTPFSS